MNYLDSDIQDYPDDDVDDIYADDDDLIAPIDERWRPVAVIAGIVFVLAGIATVVIVNGGGYQLENGQLEDAPPSAVQLFVCPERIWALDSYLHPLLLIPISQISAATAAESAGDWILRIRWADRTADFHYRGIFAEHLARVAESTLRSVIHPPLPVISQKRTATA